MIEGERADISGQCWLPKKIRRDHHIKTSMLTGRLTEFNQILLTEGRAWYHGEEYHILLGIRTIKQDESQQLSILETDIVKTTPAISAIIVHYKRLRFDTIDKNVDMSNLREWLKDHYGDITMISKTPLK